MDANIVGGTMVVGSLIGLLLGAVGGLMTGCVTAQNKKRTLEEAHLALPRRVTEFKQLSEPLLTLAKCAAKFDKGSFRALCDKLAAMIKVYGDLQGARASSVSPSMAHLGTQYEVSVRDHLQSFYYRSGVAVVARAMHDRDEKGSRDMEPVNRDMRLAHQVLMDAVCAFADQMESIARDKLSQAVHEKEYKAPPPAYRLRDGPFL